MPYQENLILGRLTCSITKQKTLCTNDIIPRKYLPAFLPDSFDYIIKKFGHKRFNDYKEYLSYINRIKPLLWHAASQMSLPFPHETIALAMTELGVGESYELSTEVFFQILNSRADIALVKITGGCKEYKGVSETLMHSIILLGLPPEYTFENEYLNGLTTLPDEVVVIDTLLNHVGKANRYLTEKSSHMNLYVISRIHSVDIASQYHKDNYELIKHNASILVNFVYEQGIPQFVIKKNAPKKVTITLFKEEVEETTTSEKKPADENSHEGAIL